MTIPGVDIERMNRCRVAMAAYAYEMHSDSLMSDHEFDALCLKINPLIETNIPELDAFFLTDFHPCTGSWIHSYPEPYLTRLSNRYNNMKKAIA